MRRLMTMGVVLGSAVVLAARAEPEPRPARRPPLDAFLASASSKALVDPATLSPAARQRALAATITGTEERYGVPTFLWAPPPVRGQRSPRDMGVTPEQAARRALAGFAELYRASPRGWADAKLRLVHDLGDGGAVIVSFEQRVQGLPVFRDEVKVIMSSRLELVAIAGYLTPALRTLGAFRLSPETAIGAAVADLTGAPLAGGALTSLGFRHGDRLFRLSEEPTPVRARPTWYATPEGLVPAFYVEVERSLGTDSEYYSWVVSADDGALLMRKNLTAADSYSYRVWADASAEHVPFDGPTGNGSTPHPTGLRSTWAPGATPTSLITLQNGPLSTNDPWLAPGSLTLDGNNAYAYADLARPNGFSVGDLGVGVSAPGVFDFSFDPASQPTANDTQRRAIVTQLFYNVNFFHDWYYDRGFDEKSGNAQANNLGRGGKGGDELYAEAQDYSGTDNANMSTPSDGASPRMQMYIFSGASSPTAVVNSSPPRSFAVGSADFGPQNFNVTAPLVLADDGVAPAADACSPLGAAVAGKLVLIDRGTCTFLQKAQYAEQAGAVGVIIADNRAGAYPPSMSGGGNSNIPTVGLTQANGTTLKSLLTAGPVTMTIAKVLTPDRDGALDNLIVAHEWGHYISNRLIGDGNGLVSSMNDGMGEGWADFHSMLLAVRAEDGAVPSNVDYAGVYGMAGYTTYAADNEGYYFGIRRVPYSTDLTKNGLTFKHVSNGVRLPSAVPTNWGLSGNDNAESHNTGEVWATMLWECYAALLRDTTRLPFAEAQDRMLRYVVAAYKATPLVPNFNEARDALLAVAAARDLADYEAFWRGFAKRGLGMGAISPPRSSRTNSPVTESFDVGSAAQVASVTLDDAVISCDHDGNLDNDEEGNLSVTVKNIGIGAMSGGQVDVSTPLAGLVFPVGSTAQVPTLTPFQSAKVDFRLNASMLHGAKGADFTVVVTAPGLVGGGTVTSRASFRVNFDLMPNIASNDDVEAPSSTWTSASDPTVGAPVTWQVFTDTATSHWWLGPDSTYPSDSWLASPPLQVGTAQDFVVTFNHRFDFEKDARGNYDGAVVEISTNDGQSWADVGLSARPGYGGTLDSQGANPLGGRTAWVGQSAGYPAFSPVTVNLGRRYAGQAVRFRFRIGTDDASGNRGWEVDDIEFAGLSNKPFSLIVSDPNACGTNRAPTLVVGPDQTVMEGATVTLLGTATDPDNEPVALTWTQRSGPAVTLSTDTFVAPHVLADTVLVFELRGADAIHDVGPVQTRVTVQSRNLAPQVSAPASLEVQEGETLTITGAATDADGDPLVLAWSQVEGPAAILSGEDTDTLTVRAPIVDQEAHLTFELIARDPSHQSLPARVDVLVKNPVLPQKPIGCGCKSGTGLEALALLGGLGLLRRRRRP